MMRARLLIVALATLALLPSCKTQYDAILSGSDTAAKYKMAFELFEAKKFAKAAENVAKTALEIVDRTARKAYRDNGGSASAGYIDTNKERNFGYGEWASRGGFGALCNWAVGTSLLRLLGVPFGAKFVASGELYAQTVSVTRKDDLSGEEIEESLEEAIRNDITG